MNTTTTFLTVFAALLSSGTAVALSDGRPWQLKQLFNPTAQDLAREAGGSMMFVRTLVTDRSGTPLRDETGRSSVTEDDDCD